MAVVRKRLTPGCTVEVGSSLAEEFGYEIYVGAEGLFDKFLSHEYGKVILPDDKVLIVRLEDCIRIK
jgi:hypothetical protein